MSTTTQAPGSTPGERITYWQSLGWPALRAMMQPATADDRPAADSLSAPRVPVRVQLTVTQPADATPR